MQTLDNDWKSKSSHTLFTEQLIEEDNIPLLSKRIKRTFIKRFELAARCYLSTILSLPILFFFVLIAIFKTARAYISEPTRLHDLNDIIPENELVTQDETYYADRWGYTSQPHQVVTKDGHILKLYRIFKKGRTTKRKPVLIGHGLFQCSGAFVLNEEKSLAFHLIDQGYDVWVGNNRSIGGLDHVSLTCHDLEYWDWGLKELALYDFAAMIQYVKKQTGYSKVAYIGHSQGNAQAFVALALKPELGVDLSCFIALAPAVYAGHLTNRFPLSLLINLSDWGYSIIFGTKAFLPVMSVVQNWFEPRLFSILAYSMFSYLFDWWDHQWIRRRKIKYFQFTPRPVSARLIADWIAGWGRKGVCLYLEDQKPLETQVTKVPLVVFYGTHDYIVNGEKFIQSIKNKQIILPALDLIHVEEIQGYEHMDTIWGHDNHQTTYPIILENLEKVNWD